jgi:hypothetical protein
MPALEGEAPMSAADLGSSTLPLAEEEDESM